MITVVDHGLCNIGSLSNMLRKIGVKSLPTSDPEVVQRAGKIILPGVGAFDPAIQKLRETGLAKAICEAANRGVPLLGICLGMQLLGNSSEEGTEPGLGLIMASTRRFKAAADLRIPNMGWNHVRVRRSHPLWKDLNEANRFYFVHSFHVCCAHDDDVVGETQYGTIFTSSVARENVLGVQFHPEKSHHFGMTLLRNFAGI